MALILEIGDWIHRPDCYDKVTEIRNGGIIGLDHLRGLILNNEIEPIPLTKEMLLDNHWNILDHQIWNSEYPIHSVFEYYDGLTTTSFALQQFEEFGSFVFGVDSCLWQGTSINYVHELQHCLRICGYSDIANNFKID